VPVALTSTFLRIECDREHCRNVIVHHPFVFEDDHEEYPPAVIEANWPPVRKSSPQEPSRWLCAECMAGAQSGTIKVRWRKP
jgi:hypothetical protein